MKFTELTVLLDCHSLEDFPTYHEGRRADELLAAWCALWHPALVASAGSIPAWQRVDMPPEALSGRLLSVAPYALERLPAGFAGRIKAEGGHLVHEAGRDAAVAAALAPLDDQQAARVDPQFAADFLALGFCRLQIELLTRHMRYSPHIDETHFQNQAVAAARAAVEGRTDEARTPLDECFGVLYEARKHFYPAEFYLIDLTLLAQTTLGKPFKRELASSTPRNLLASVGLVESLARDDPSTWSEVPAAIDRGTTCILGNELAERELPLLPIEAVRALLADGVRRYETLLGRRPQVYGRRRNGLTPTLPQILSKLGYQGALHFTLDDGRFPLAAQSKTRWEGLDSSVIDIFGRVPLDAAKPESFLGLARHMADAMDHDHVATLCFAHWPGIASGWYTDLRRIAELSPVLGKFMLCDDYFSHTDMSGRLSKFEPDEYRAPYLIQDIIKRQGDPVSRFVREHRAQAASAAAEAIAALADLIAGKSRDLSAARSKSEIEPPSATSTELQAVSQALGRFALALPRQTSAPTAGALVVNSLSFARRMGVEFAGWQHPPEVAGAVISADSLGDRQLAVVEVPALGFAWVQPAASPGGPSRAKPIARENVLANEFFEVTISRGSGGIQSIYSFAQRGNLLSQQVAYRLPSPVSAGSSAGDEEENYTAMQAESVEITASSTVFGEITSRGSLVGPDGRRLGGFRQKTQVWSASRVIGVEIELEDLEEPLADPWNSYCAARFAWSADDAELYRGVGWTRQKTQATRLEAPEYIDIDSGQSLTILTGGLPYHRRSGSRMLDSLLVVRGETARSFSLGIGVDLAQPAAAAIERLTPATVLLEMAAPPSASSGWFFHLDARNVLATHWEPLVDDAPGEEKSAGGPRTVMGFRARLLETAGRSGRITLRAFRPLQSARQVDFLGQTLLEARVDDDKIALDFGAHEWIEVEALWTR